MTSTNIKIKPVSELITSLDILEKKYNRPVNNTPSNPIAPKLG